MKSDLFTAVVAAVVGVLVAYFVCNLFLPGLENVSFKVLSNSESYNLTNPDEEVFNYRALNPTVEVYVGDCQEYDENGECKDDKISGDEEMEENPEETDENAEDNTGEDENGATD